MVDRAAKMALFDEFARVGKALASGRRIELLDVLANGERTVEGLAGEVGLSLANASQHLQVLRQAGLVATRRDGNSIHYRLAAPEVFGLWRALRPWPPPGWPRWSGWPPPTWAPVTSWSR